MRSVIRIGIQKDIRILTLTLTSSGKYQSTLIGCVYFNGLDAEAWKYTKQFTS